MPAGRKPRIGLALSGIPPAMTLMSGAMLGFMEKGIEFDAISTSGAGALIALLALAPKDKTPKQALEELPNLFVSDAVYSVLPINFKLLTRNSDFSRPMYEFSKHLPRFTIAPRDPSPLKRLYNDWVDLACAALTPSFEPGTSALLSHNPRIADMVDFTKLRAGNSRFYMSAFDLNSKQVKIFERNDTNLEAYYAAVSLPLLFAPQRVGGGDLFYSGLTHDAAGLQAIWLKETRQLDMVLALDPLSAAFWREPTDIADAFKLMLANPIIALETLTMALYSRTDRAVEELADHARRLPPLYRVAVPFGDGRPETLLKWTHSGAVALQDLGYRAATSFAELLLSGDQQALEKQRFHRSPESARMDHFMALLDPLFGAHQGKDTTAPAKAAARAKPSPPKSANWWEARSGVGVLVGGGAPNLHLSAGALCAFYENRVSFDVIGSSGAGALAGLLYAAPKREGSQIEALQGSVYLNVSDLIERFLPMNYKVFFKKGPFSDPAWRLGQALPRFEMRADERFDNALKRLYNDALDLTISMLTPTTLHFRSKGMCSRVGMLDDVIAWDRLPQYPKQFYLNAFDLTTQRLEEFDKTELTEERFWAALAMVWLFEPARMDGKVYTEGASHDPSGLEALGLRGLGAGGTRAAEVASLDKIVALETVGPDLWTNPGTMYEALEMTIMEPIVSLAELVLGTYGLFEYLVNERRPGALPRLYGLPFPVPDWEVPNVLRWSYSNALTLWHVGHQSATDFVRVMDLDEIEQYRYYPRNKDKPRMRDMLALFADIVGAQEARRAAGAQPI